jgi:predicted chitinase
MNIKSFRNWKSINEQNLRDSSYVTSIQNQLLELGYDLPKYGADGKYGPETKSAVIELQSYLMSKGYDLPKYGADGMWGSETELALEKFKSDSPDSKKNIKGSILNRRNRRRKQRKANKNTPSNNLSNDVSITNGKISHNYSGIAAENIDKIIAAGKKRGITNPNTLVGILSIVGKESGFVPKSENSYANTSNSRIRKIFGNARLGKDKYSDAELSRIKKDPATFWEAVYGYKTYMGRRNLGNNEPGDGGKYRGRGYNQLTGKANYKTTGADIGRDLVNNPDLVNNVEVAAEVLFSYLKRNVTDRRVAGGLNGFTNVDDAVKNIARANAGWGNGYESDNVLGAIANSQRIQKNFNIA